jgi:hypothetical protein
MDELVELVAGSKVILDMMSKFPVKIDIVEFLRVL